MSYMRFSKVLVKSPFKPIHKHAEKAYEAVKKLGELMQAYCDGDHQRVLDLSEEITNLEHEADIAKQTARTRMPKSVLMPVDRQDVFHFLAPQDAIADKAEDVAKLATFMEPAPLPDDVKHDLLEMMRYVLNTVEAYMKMVGEISELLETSFSKKEVQRTIKLVSVVEELEHETDIIHLQLTRKVYKLEDELGALSVYHVLKMVRTLDDVADGAARAADRLRTMISRK